jgi:hypothetical protein
VGLVVAVCKILLAVVALAISPRGVIEMSW